MTTELRMVRMNEETAQSNIRNAQQLLYAIRAKCRVYSVPEEELLALDILELVTATEARLEQALNRLEVK